LFNASSLTQLAIPRADKPALSELGLQEPGLSEPALSGETDVERDTRDANIHAARPIE
jgi:hypothetical protein